MASRRRGFSLSLSIGSSTHTTTNTNTNTNNTPTLLSRRQSIASVFLPSPAGSSSTTPSTPGRFKRALKRIGGSIRIPFTRRHSSASAGWGRGWGDSDYMYDDDMDVSYEGLLRLAARIGDAKPKNLPQEFKDALPRGVWATCEAARVGDDRCAICLDKYEDQDAVMGINECGHYFHSHCFDKWLDLASNCPVCRKELTPEDYHFDPNNVTSSPSSPSSPTSPTSPISLGSYFGSNASGGGPLPPLSPIPPVVMEETTSRIESDDEEEEEGEGVDGVGEEGLVRRPRSVHYHTSPI